MKSEKLTISKYLFVCFFAVSVLLLTPYFERFAYRPLFLTFFLISMVLIFYFISYVKDKKGRIPKYIPWLIIWILYALFYHFIGYSNVSFGNEFEYYKFYFLAISFIVYDNYCNKKDRKRLFVGIWIILLINIIINIFEISHNLAASTLIMIKGNEYLNTNIGSGSFISTIYLFAIVMIWVFLFSDGRKVKLCALVSYILSSYLLVILYNRASTSFLLIIFSLAIIFVKFQNKIKNKQRLMISLLALIIGLPLSYIILRQIAEVFRINRLIDRLDWISQLFSLQLKVGIIGENSLSSRLYLIWGTIKNWFRSPVTFFFGVGDNLRSTRSITEMFNVTGVGYHSDIIDVLGTHGLIGALIFWNILRLIYKELKSKSSEIKQNGFGILYLGFIMCLFFNRTLGGELGIIIFLILPNLSLFSHMRAKDSDNNNKYS